MTSDKNDHTGLAPVVDLMETYLLYSYLPTIKNAGDYGFIKEIPFMKNIFIEKYPKPKKDYKLFEELSFKFKDIDIADRLSILMRSKTYTRFDIQFISQLFLKISEEPSKTGITRQYTAPELGVLIYEVFMQFAAFEVFPYNIWSYSHCTLNKILDAIADDNKYLKRCFYIRYLAKTQPDDPVKYVINQIYTIDGGDFAWKT